MHQSTTQVEFSPLDTRSSYLLVSVSWQLPFMNWQYRDGMCSKGPLKGDDGSRAG
jgi:hypothetical protein